jgi:predicted enzyme related to lactoylglutathione lyase
MPRREPRRKPPRPAPIERSRGGRSALTAVGDLHVYVTDFERALRFWVDGLRLIVAEREVTLGSAFARLDFPDGGPSIHLVGGVDPWGAAERPASGSRPSVGFDITTTDFDEVLARLLESGGSMEGMVETYDTLRVTTIVDPDGTSFDLIELPSD